MDRRVVRALVLDADRPAKADPVEELSIRG
jgi:hypothetical protein